MNHLSRRPEGGHRVDPRETEAIVEAIVEAIMEAIVEAIMEAIMELHWRL